MKPPVDFYFDLISPFAYLAAMRIQQVAKRHGRDVNWRPVLVGVTVQKVMGMRPIPDYPLKGPYMRQDAIRLARFLNVPFQFHSVPSPKSVSGMRAFLWLKERDPELAVAFAKRLFVRLWVDGGDITSPKALLEVARSTGVDDCRGLGDWVSTPQARDALNQAVDYAIQNGVFGVPFFRVDGESLWGVDRLPMLEHWLEHGTWDASSSVCSEKR